MTLSTTDIHNLIFLGLAIPFIFGIVMGCMNKITIFNDYNDLGLTFFMLIFPIPMMYLYIWLGKSQVMLYVFILIEVILLGFLMYRSFIDNRKNFFSTILSLYTKIPLSIIYLFNLFLVFDDIFSKNRIKRNKFSFLLIAILTPIAAKLVRNKTGVFR